MIGLQIWLKCWQKSGGSNSVVMSVPSHFEITWKVV